MIITEVLAEIADQLDTIPKLNVFPFWAKKVPVPGATVGPPEKIEFDQTYGRGSDKMTVPILVLVGAVSSEQSIRDLSAYMDGEGARSFKVVLNGYEWTTCDDVMVTECVPDTYTSGGVTLLGAEFTALITGQGVAS